MKYFVFIWLMFLALNASSQENHAHQDSINDTEIAIFIGLDCPISQKYIYRLNEIYKKYKNYHSIRWSFIVPENVKKKKVRQFSKEYSVNFPLKADDKFLSKTKYFNASVTPEVIILQSNKSIYRGAIDNWFYELGRYRTITTEQYLIDALDSIIKHQKPLIMETRAIGCFIKTYSTLNPHHLHE